MQEQQAKAEKEKSTVGKLNDKLNAAKTAADAGDYDTAIAALTEATQMDATRDLIWFKLGDYYRMSAPKQTDPAEKQKRLDSAVESYQKAVDLKKAAARQGSRLSRPRTWPLTTTTWRMLTPKAKKVDDAVKTYELAAQTDPSSAGAGLLQYRRGPHQFRQADEANRRIR